MIDTLTQYDTDGKFSTYDDDNTENPQLQVKFHNTWRKFIFIFNNLLLWTFFKGPFSNRWRVYFWRIDSTGSEAFADKLTGATVFGVRTDSFDNSYVSVGGKTQVRSDKWQSIVEITGTPGFISDSAVDSKGNIYMTGAWTVTRGSVWKYSPDGTLTDFYDTGRNTTGIFVDSTDYIYVVGLDNGNHVLWKLNPAGGLEWGYDTHGTDLRRVIVNSVGDVYITGIKVANKNVWKLDSMGGLVWDYLSGTGIGNDITLDTNENILVAANNVGLEKLNPAGISQWTFEVPDDGKGVAVDSNDNVFVVGKRTGNKSVWKTNSAGVQQWDYDTGADAKKCATNSNGDVLAVGNFVDLT